MTIKQLVDQVADSTVPLYKSLLIAKVIASRLKNEGLLNWINLELKGYNKKDEASIPKYRFVKLATHCTLNIGGEVKYNSTFPVTLLTDERVRASLMVKGVTDGVSALEAHLLRVDPDKFYGKQLGEDLAAVLTNHIQAAGHRVSVSDICTQVPFTELELLLSGARNVLLELLLEIEGEFPNLPDVSSFGNETREAVNQVINIYLEESGSANISGTSITTSGQSNTVAANVGSNNELKKSKRKP